MTMAKAKLFIGFKNGKVCAMLFTTASNYESAVDCDYSIEANEGTEQKKVKEFREKVITDKIQQRKDMNKFWRKENKPKSCEPEELTDEEKQNLQDFICVQKWDGKKFACVCGDLGVT